MAGAENWALRGTGKRWSVYLTRGMLSEWDGLGRPAPSDVVRAGLKALGSDRNRVRAVEGYLLAVSPGLWEAAMSGARRAGVSPAAWVEQALVNLSVFTPPFPAGCHGTGSEGPAGDAAGSVT